MLLTIQKAARRHEHLAEGAPPAAFRAPRMGSPTVDEGDLYLSSFPLTAFHADTSDDLALGVSAELSQKTVWREYDSVAQYPSLSES